MVWFDMPIFILIVISILALCWFYVWYSFVFLSSFSVAMTSLASSFLVFTFALQIFRWTRRSFFETNPRLLFFTYFMLGLMSHLFCAGIPKDIFFAFSGEDLSLENIRNLNVIVFFLGFVANLWGVKTALSGPIIREAKVPLKNWPGHLSDFRIAQLSDLHIGPMIGVREVRNMVEKVMALNPHVIVITGDIADAIPQDVPLALNELAKLKALCGVFYVSGNHEIYAGLNLWHEAIKKLGFRVLINDGQFIDYESEKIFIGGVPDFSLKRFLPEAGSQPGVAIQNAKSFAGPKILLAHQPKSCFEAAHAGFDLMLSGHTHWGQFFPFSLLVGFFNPYHKGLNLHNDMWVYVNAGTGFWGPPVRLWVPSEITLIRPLASQSV